MFWHENKMYSNVTYQKKTNIIIHTKNTVTVKAYQVLTEMFDVTWPSVREHNIKSRRERRDNFRQISKMRDYIFCWALGGKLLTADTVCDNHRIAVYECEWLNIHTT